MKRVYILYVIIFLRIFCNVTAQNTEHETQHSTQHDAENASAHVTDNSTGLTTDPTAEHKTSKAVTYHHSHHHHHSSTITIPPVTFYVPKYTKFARYKFESVDYNEMPQAFISTHNDCYGQFIRCIRFRTDHTYVCGYNVLSEDYENFYSPCEIERVNCHYRVYYNMGLYGYKYSNDFVYFNGEGRSCYYYVRRAKNKEDMHRLYFGDNEPPRLTRRNKRK